MSTVLGPRSQFHWMFHFRNHIRTLFHIPVYDWLLLRASSLLFARRWLTTRKKNVRTPEGNTVFCLSRSVLYTHNLAVGGIGHLIGSMRGEVARFGRGFHDAAATIYKEFHQAFVNRKGKRGLKEIRARGTDSAVVVCLCGVSWW